MDHTTALANLPEALLPPRLVAAVVPSAKLGEMLDEQRRVENRAFCRTMTATYALFRDRYGERESAFLSSDIEQGADFYARRQELSLAYSALKAEVMVALRLGPTAAETAIDQAIGFVERLPRVFALVDANVISARGGQEALSRCRALSTAQALEFDERLATVLTACAEQLTAIPALREAADRIVHDIDPAAAERRRKQAEEDRTFTVRPADDGMAMAYALLTAHEIRELESRVDEVAETACDCDPRTASQRRADAFVMLFRGFTTLGCRCAVPVCRFAPIRREGQEDSDGARVVIRYRTLVHVIINEKTLADPADTDAAYLIGHGPITAEQAREISLRDDAVIRPFGQEVDDSPTAPQPTPDPAADPAANTPAESAAPEPVSVYRWSGIDLVRRRPVGILLAARCRHAGAPANGAGATDTDGAAHTLDSAASDTAADTRDAAATAAARRPHTRPTPTHSPRALSPRALVIAQGSTGYRFSADLKRYFHILFPRCVFPMCTRPASRCQIDHRREYDHADPERGGASTADNGQPLCLPHHQLKTAGIWVDAHLPDGRILWTGPNGRRVVVDPSGTILGLFPDLTRITWTSPPAAPSKPRSPGGPTRLQREHERRERIRDRNLEELERRAHPGTVSTVERRLDAALAGTTPASLPPPDDEPPPF
ncbi:HNH endonuclease signature motif containing protein [Tsukamurella pseudospumae]|uniref:DUF222 domain-containing protein n=1 Tax=Tsukamurella pseudospumae TaxID=239498 RepID=A0A138AV00_9ACTN|nr:HNH endonuclease signature motif containing protein [Tsukamurella pseudospumae]KXP14278.1 hypothetical protein AXK60_20890 [Tsukamurella pseudospumae]